MPMNSFSFRSAERNETDRSQDHCEELYEELSGVLEVQKIGELIANKHAKRFRKIDFQPVNLENLKNRWSDPSGRRIAPRFNLQMTVLICSHTKSFRSQTKNISLSGLCLQDILPEDFNRGVFDVVLIQEDEIGKKCRTTCR